MAQDALYPYGIGRQKAKCCAGTENTINVERETIVLPYLIFPRPSGSIGLPAVSRVECNIFSDRGFPGLYNKNVLRVMVLVGDFSLTYVYIPWQDNRIGMPYRNTGQIL